MRPACWPNAAVAARQIASRKARIGGIMPARALDKRYGSLRRPRIAARGTRVVPILATDEAGRGHPIEVRPDAAFPPPLGPVDLPRAGFLEDAHELTLAHS